MATEHPIDLDPAWRWVEPRRTDFLLVYADDGLHFAETDGTVLRQLEGTGGVACPLAHCRATRSLFMARVRGRSADVSEWSASIGELSLDGLEYREVVAFPQGLTPLWMLEATPDGSRAFAYVLEATGGTQRSLIGVVDPSRGTIDLAPIEAPVFYPCVYSPEHEDVLFSSTLNTGAAYHLVGVDGRTKAVVPLKAHVAANSAAIGPENSIILATPELQVWTRSTGALVGLGCWGDHPRWHEGRLWYSHTHGDLHCLEDGEETRVLFAPDNDPEVGFGYQCSPVIAGSVVMAQITTAAQPDGWDSSGIDRADLVQRQIDEYDVSHTRVFLDLQTRTAWRVPGYAQETLLLEKGEVSFEGAR